MAPCSLKRGARGRWKLEIEPWSAVLDCNLWKVETGNWLDAACEKQNGKCEG